MSELATNALAHSVTGSGGYFDVTVVAGEISALIAVTDQGSDQVLVHAACDLDSEAGRGLELVELIANRWGHGGGRHGRTVWFELRWQPEEADATEELSHRPQRSRH